MTTPTEANQRQRIPLSRDRVLRAAVALADRSGLEALSMRKLGQELGVEAMSLYNHVANKDEILAGIIDIVIGEIEIAPPGDDWKKTMRTQLLAARESMRQHKWAAPLIESRTALTPKLMAYMDSIVGIFISGGFSHDITHHALHMMGSRALGFTQELFDDTGDGGDMEEAVDLLETQPDLFPNITAMLMTITHDADTVVGTGCDDDEEFMFALELMLDGLERLRDAE